MNEGEVVALLGRNGVGKTTTVSIIAGLLSPDQGAVLLGRDKVPPGKDAADLIGVAPQETAVQLATSVRDNLEFYAALQGVPKSEVKSRIEWALDAFALDGLVDRIAQSLSGGERRRLHTATAAIARPPLLLLDEPTVGADIETRLKILDVVKELAAEGATILYTTHYLPEVEEVSARVIILDDGVILADDALPTLLGQYATTAVEFQFDGIPPDVQHASADIVVDGSIVRMSGIPPARAVVDVVSSLDGDGSTKLAGIELVPPSLDSVFLSLTGERFSVEEAG